MSDSIPTPRRSRLVVLGGLSAALVLASGATAVGATMVTSKMIKNDTVRTVDLNFPVGQDASSLPDKVTLTGPKPEPVLAATLTVDDAGGSGIAQGFVELRNSTGNAATVEVTLVHQQDPTHTSSVTTTLKVGESTSVPVGLLCNGMPAGDQTVQLSVTGVSGIVVQSAFLSAIAGPRT